MRRVWMAAVVVLCLVAWGAYEYRTGTGTAEPAGAAAGPPGVPVTMAAAEARNLPIFARGIGTVQAYNAVSVRSRVDGQIVKVDFTEGQEVKPGDPLFEIDPRPFQAALAQAVATKAKDQAQLVSAQADLDRFSQLVGKGYQTRQSVDQQKGLVGQLQAAVQADQAQIESAQLNLQFCTIRAPIGGRTGARLVDVGNLVHSSDNTALVTVTQLRPIFVAFTLPQDRIDDIREAQRNGPLEADARSQADDKPLATGKLTLIDNQVDQTTGTIRLKATFDNQDETLWPGEFVNVRLVLRVAENAVTVPARAIQQGPNGDYVYVIKPDMTVEMRNVRVGQVEDGVAQIEQGLETGERVVVDGQYRLDQGTRVALQNAPDQ